MSMRVKMLNSMYMLRMAAMAICLLQATVMTSLPDEKRRTVVLGLSMRTVMTAFSDAEVLCACP